MTIGGFQPFSLNEFPGRIAAIVFLRGCNLRCPYCHNPELVDPGCYADPLPAAQVLGDLAGRVGRLQGVVITGGEPTLQDDLESFIGQIRALGLEVKLDTNGTHPEVLQRLVDRGALSHVGLDIKAPIRKYRELTRAEVDPEAVQRSLEFLRVCGIRHEIRTTWLPGLLTFEEMLEIAKLVHGCAAWAVQRFVPSKALDPAVLGMAPPTLEAMEQLRVAAEALGVRCVVR